MAIRPRNDPVRLFGRRLLLLTLFVLVVAAMTGAWNAYRKERESSALRTQAEAQLADLSKRQGALNADIAMLQTERGKEAVLRSQYALAGRGEEVVVIVNATNTQVHATSSAFAGWLHKVFPWWR